MAKNFGPLPTQMALAPTLAQRIGQLRDFRNLTIRDLAKLARFAPERIEDLEAGLETWLSASDRQRLAKALSVEAITLQEVEQRATLSSTTEAKKYTADVIRELVHSIINGARDLDCSECGGSLKCSVQQGLDLESNEILLARAFCTKCPFILHG